MNKIDTAAIYDDNFGVYESIPFIVLNACADGGIRTFSVELNNITCYDFPRQRKIPLRTDEGMRVMTPCHQHERLEIFYVRSGKADIYTEDAVYSCGSGDIMLFNSFEQHGIDIDEKSPVAYSVFGIPLSLFSKCSVFNYVENLRHEGKKFISFYPVSHPLSPELRSCLDRTVEAVGKSLPGWEYDVMGYLLHEIGLLLSHNMITDRPDDSTDSINFIEKVAHYLEAHFQEDIGLTSIAAELNYSREHFCRLFRKYYGLSFHEYLNIYRITLAKDILRRENHPDIATVSSMIGYNNTTYFSRIFRKLCGVSPRNFSEKTKTCMDGNLPPP